MPLGNSPILLTSLMAEGDTNKHILFNDAVVKLEDSINRQVSVDLSAGDATLTETQFLAHGVLRFHGHTVGRTVTIPTTISGGTNPTNRVLVIRNQGTGILTFTHGSGIEGTIPAEGAGIVYANGTDIIALAGVATAPDVAVNQSGVEVVPDFDYLNFIGTNITVEDDGVNGVNITIGDTDSFLHLTDTPSAYAGNQGRAVLVNAAGDGLEFGDVVSPNFLGVYTSLANLQSAHPAPEPGRYAHVDAGVGTDVVVYVWDNTDAAYVEGGSAGALTDAPSDGTQYARQDGAWVAVESTGGIADAPSDGTIYGRQNGAWVEAPTGSGGGGGIPDAPEDGNAYARQDAGWVQVNQDMALVGYAPKYARGTWPEYTPSVFGTWVAMTFTGASGDELGFFNVGGANPSRIYIPAGVDKVRFTVSVWETAQGGQVTGNSQVKLWKNGAIMGIGDGTFNIEPDDGDGFTNSGETGVSAILNVVEGDYFEVRQYSDADDTSIEGWAEVEVIAGAALTADEVLGGSIEAALDTYYGSTAWRTGGSGSMTAEQIEAALDTYYGSTEWRTGGGTMTAEQIETALDTYYGGAGWRTDTDTQLSAEGIEAALDAYYGSTEWRTGGGGGSRRAASTTFHDETYPAVALMESVVVPVPSSARFVEFDIFVPAGNVTNAAMRFNELADTGEYNFTRITALDGTIGSSETADTNSAIAINGSSNTDGTDAFHHRLTAKQPVEGGPIYFEVVSSAGDQTRFEASGVYLNTAGEPLTSLEILPAYNAGWPAGAVIIARDLEKSQNPDFNSVGPAYTDVGLVNGDFETGDMTGWTVTVGTANVVDEATMDSWFGVGGGSAARNGSYVLAGGAQAQFTAYQDVDISSFVSSAQQFRLSADLMKDFDDADMPVVRLTLLDAQGLAIHEGTVAYPHTLPGLEYVSVVVPSDPAAVTARVTLDITRNDGTYNSAAIDNVALQAVSYVVGGLKTTPLGMARTELSANQSISASTNTIIPWDGTSFDDGEWWSAGEPSRLTVPEGVSRVAVHAGFRSTAALSSTTDWIMRLLKNGVTITSFVIDNQYWGPPNMATGTIAVEPGDYFELEVWCTSGFTLEGATAFLEATEVVQFTGGGGGGGGGSYPSLSKNAQTASYTLADTDLVGNRIVTIESATVAAVTVPAGLIGTEPVTVIRKGTGAVSVAADVGVTINSADGALSLRAQYSSAVLIPDGTDTYLLVGDLA